MAVCPHCAADFVERQVTCACRQRSTVGTRGSESEDGPQHAWVACSHCVAELVERQVTGHELREIVTKRRETE